MSALSQPLGSRISAAIVPACLSCLLLFIGCSSRKESAAEISNPIRPPRQLDLPASQPAIDKIPTIDLAMDASGTAHLVWSGFARTPWTVSSWYQRSSDVGATWSAPIPIRLQQGGSPRIIPTPGRLYVVLGPGLDLLESVNDGKSWRELGHFVESAVGRGYFDATACGDSLIITYLEALNMDHGSERVALHVVIWRRGHPAESQALGEFDAAANVGPGPRLAYVDGTLHLTCALLDWRTDHVKVFAWRSPDRGASWSKRTDLRIGDEAQAALGEMEPDLAFVSRPGRLLILLCEGRICGFESKDGSTWTDGRLVGTEIVEQQNSPFQTMISGAVVGGGIALAIVVPGASGDNILSLESAHAESGLGGLAAAAKRRVNRDPARVSAVRIVGTDGQRVCVWAEDKYPSQSTLNVASWNQ